MKKVKCFLAVLMLSSVMLLGCGDSAEKVESDSDQCVVVQVPDGSTVEELFTFIFKNPNGIVVLGRR